MLKCFYCKKNSHFKKDCRNFLNRADKKGTSKTRICFENSFVDVPHSTWWIYMGATSHISNSLQGFQTRRKPSDGERRIFMENGVEAKVKVGTCRIIVSTNYALDLVPFCAFYKKKSCFSFKT